VMTGVGAVFNAAKVEPRATVAVIGCGGVGLSAERGRPRRRRGTRPPPYRKRSAGKWPDPHSSGVLQNTSETRAGPVF